MRTKHLSVVIICALVIAFLSACSWERRKPLTVGEISRQFPSHTENIVVYFVEVVPSKPLPETVWDNVSGPFWNIAESNQIGFTQHYKAQFFAIPPALLPAVAQSGVNLIDSQLMMPFGRTFTGVFESALKASFSKYQICYDNPCVEKSIQQADYNRVLKIKISNFNVWEGPLNHLNLYVKGSCKLIHKDGTMVKEYEFESELLKQTLGSVLSTHSSMITEMNRLLNKFAEDLSVEIFTKLNT
jgi:hypothetical protein